MKNKVIVVVGPTAVGKTKIAIELAKYLTDTYQFVFECLKAIGYFPRKCGKKGIIAELNKIENLDCNILELKNEFFGEKVTVAGLITGQDLINQVKDKGIENLIIPTIMLRPYSECFLDGVTLSEVTEKTGCKIFVIKDIYSTKEFLDLIITKF